MFCEVREMVDGGCHMPRENTMTTAQLAKLVRATPRWILKLTADGVLHRAQDADGSELRGRYHARAIGDFCDYLRRQARIDDSSELRYTALRNEKLAAENELTQLNLAERKGQLHNSDDVEFVMTQMLTAFKARILAAQSPRSVTTLAATMAAVCLPSLLRCHSRPRDPKRRHLSRH